jgi:predicted transcriptional regulator of viral defense system
MSRTAAPKYNRRTRTEASRAERVRRASALLGSLNKHVYLQAELRKLLQKSRAELELPASFRPSQFIDLLTEEGLLRRVTLTSSHSELVRYIRPGASAYSVGLSIRNGSYLSHSSAMILHHLTGQIPKTIFVNKEQSPKSNDPDSLTQAGIDRAFKSAGRVSTYTFRYEDVDFLLLSGKSSGRLEVSDFEVRSGELVAATKLERTLIDIAVRPNYAGGIHEVTRAYAAAKHLVSINLLLATLKKLDYVYPYHQAIGFYMERAAYSKEQLDKIRTLPRNWSFYLTYDMKDPQFDSAWSIYYPQGF